MLRQALADLGSQARLAAALDTSVEQVDAWLAGREEVPPHAFFAALDIVAKRFRASSAFPGLAPSARR